MVLPRTAPQNQISIREIENEAHKFKRPQPNFAPVDTVVQRTFGPLAMPTPGITFEGYSQQDNFNINNGLGGVPPDTEGDVGPNHYFQWVNLGIRIFDKSGNTVLGPILGNSLWSGFPGACTANNMGDPDVLYDPLADRWVATQFAVPSRSSGPSYECIAISTSPDPTGSYYRYEFQTSATNFEDYPHLGVWPDAYYMTTNEFSSPVTFAGAGNFAFDRAKMLVGDTTATMQYFHLDPPHGGLLPTDLDGIIPPPAGSPNYFIEMVDDASGAPQDHLAVYRFHVDFLLPTNSTFTGPTVLPTAPFDSQLCTADRGACIPQPNPASLLEDLSDRLMQRIAYRNFGDHEAAVLNHTVDADGAGLAGIRWYELRGLNLAPSIFQQGTYAPDSNHRWMGSIAMDSSGNIGVGYSVSSASVAPSIRYAGRLVGDPLGQLGQGEGTMYPGGGSQTDYARWGDYSAMSVDPLDECTFWFTTEYYSGDSGGDWQTRIGSFKFPSCVSAATYTPTPTITGTPPTATATRTVTNTPTITPTPLCGAFTGSITNSDPVQIGRLLRNQSASACNVPRACPGTNDLLPHHYDAYTFVNTSATAACIVAQLDQVGCPLGLFSTAYLGSFDPNNICSANYLGDMGASPAPAYQFTVPAGATFVIVVNEVTPNTGCANYTLTVNGVGTCPTTPTPTPASVLVGHVTWQGRPAQPSGLQQLPITLSLKSGSTEANYAPQTTDASGRFTVTTGLPGGTYSYRVKDPKYLANGGSVTLAPGTNNVEMGLMRAGDCNNDNADNVQDFNIQKATFGKAAGDPGYDDRGDFTGDQQVNIQDFGLLRGNFGTAGSPPLGPVGR
jgi:hypothetical protein